MTTNFDGVKIADDAIFLEFRGDKAFGAHDAMEQWCDENGVSAGVPCAGKPGLMWGAYRIAKWKNLTVKEIAGLHGLVRGDFRNGPITLRLNRNPNAPSDPRTTEIVGER